MNYLNTSKNRDSFEELLNADVFVDKSLLIDEVNGYMNTLDCCINLKRPNGFGKSVNANMLATYYNCKVDSKDLFDDLNIAASPNYLEHLNKHNVIYIDFTEVYDGTNNYQEFINKLKLNISSDLIEAYPEIIFKSHYSISDMLYKTKEQFIFIFDEWDCVFNDTYFTLQDKKDYTMFLRGLLKDQAYAELVYFTGVFSIPQYSSGSGLNMFMQYSFLEDRTFSEFFGFTEEEVKELCLKHEMDFEEVSDWYNGYYDSIDNRLYNPKSLSKALMQKKCKSYWSEIGPMNKVSDFIQNNVDAVREDIIDMIAGNPVEIYFDEQFSAETLTLNTRDEILSAMVMYGFLSYYDSYLSIPNKELMMKFENALCELEKSVE